MEGAPFHTTRNLFLFTFLFAKHADEPPLSWISRYFGPPAKDDPFTHKNRGKRTKHGETFCCQSLCGEHS